MPPEGTPSAKLWLIGEAPGQDEVALGHPFAGKSGEKLDQLLQSIGVARKQCYITNLSHYRPYNNNFKYLEGSAELKAGLDEIVENLVKTPPKVIVLLGSEALKYVAKKEGIRKWRGSVIDLPVNQSIVKLIATYHPAYVLRDPIGYPLAKLDLIRAKQILNGTFISKTRTITIADNSNIDDIHYRLKRSRKISCDVESTKSGDLLCVGFAVSPTEAFVIPYSSDIRIHALLTDILADETIEKIMHNGGFDTTMLQLHGFTVRGYKHDTLIAANLLAPELPKDLAFLTSVCTDVPYYKEEGRAEIPSDTKVWGAKRNKQELYIYNGKDDYVTYEINEEQLKELAEDVDLDALYKYSMEAQEMAIDMGNYGMLLDEERRTLLQSAVQMRRVETQHLANAVASAVIGRQVVVNVRSTKEFPRLLYTADGFNFPERKKHNKKKDTSSVTADENAIVSLIAYCKKKMEDLGVGDTRDMWTLKFKFLELVLKLREYDKQLSSYLNIKTHGSSGRVKCMYRVSGTETGRWSCSLFIDGSGVNMQTIPREKIEV